MPAGRHVKGSFAVTLGLEDVTSVSRRIPFRCTVKVEADAVDTAPDPDDAANPANNSASVGPSSARAAHAALRALRTYGYSRSTTSSANRSRFSTRPRRLWWMFRRRATSSFRSSA